MRRYISLILSFVIFMSIFVLDVSNVKASGYSITHYKALNFTDPLYIPSYIPDKSTNGYDFDDKYWVDGKYHVIVYGTEADVDKVTHNDRIGSEYRYLGFDKEGNPISNPYFPNDASSSKPLAEKNWLPSPWNNPNIDCEQTIFSASDKLRSIINRMALPSPAGLGWSPNVSGGEFYKWGNVQSMPTLQQPGSFRMWHQTSDGKIWYQTFEIPKLGEKKDTPFTVTTEIVSNDFTIAENETSVDVTVKVKATLEDDIYYNDPIDKILYYNREDIKKWDLKVEYKGTYVDIILPPNGTNTRTNTFTIKLSRSQLKDKETVTFNGKARVTFHNDYSYLDADPQSKQFNVLTPPPDAKLPPDLTITAPFEVNIKQTYAVTVNPVIPQGESIKSVALEASINGGPYQPVTLSGYTATQMYNSISNINYRATITLNNNLSKTATAITNVVDKRKSDANAKIESPSEVYEGFWTTLKNRNTFRFDDATYNAQQASGLGIGSSDIEIQDDSQYPLDNDMYQIRNYDSNVSTEIRYTQPGLYKNTCWAFPINGEPVSDTKRIQVMRCPAIIASVDGTKKSNRKLTLNFSGTVVHPDYPLVSSKTSVVIEDTVTGEKVTCTNSSAPDSTNIKTNSLSGNKMDFLIKTSVDKIYKATVYVEDTRGNSDMQSITFTVAQDKAPIAKISTKAQELRKPSLFNKAEIFLQDDSYSEDGDYVTRTWEVAIDTDNDGLFTDETYKAVNLLDGYQDISGDSSQKKVRFLKTGVGKINARVKIKEAFGQPTIDAFVTAADRKEAAVTQTVDVINVAPVVDFKVFSNVPTTINLVVGSLSDALQTSVQNFIASLQSTLLSNKITPTINFIPQTFDTSRPIWNQTGGNALNSNQSKFNGVLNTNLKWNYIMDLTVRDSSYEAQFLSMPDGSLLYYNSYNYRDSVQTWIWHYVTDVRLISKNGTLIKAAQLPFTAYRSAILSDGRIVFGSYNNTYPNYGVFKFEVYDSNLNWLNTFNIPGGGGLATNIAVDTADRMYFVAGSGGNLYLDVINSDFTLRTHSFIGKVESLYDVSPYEIFVDSQGNSYFTALKYAVYKYDINGNQIFNVPYMCYGSDILAVDEAGQALYFRYRDYSDYNQTLYKMSTVDGSIIMTRKFTTIYSMSDASINSTHLFIPDGDVRIKVIKKSDLSIDTSISPYGIPVGDFPQRPVISANNQLVCYDPSLDDAKFYMAPDGSMTYLNALNGAPSVIYKCFFGADNTLYILGANVDFYGSHGQAICTGKNYFITAIGTGGTPQNVDNTLNKMNGYIPSNNTVDFTVSITDSPFQGNTDANITAAANLLKSKNDRFLMIGNSSSKPDGQKILNKGVAGGLYDINTNMSTPLISIGDYIISTLRSPNRKVYEYSYSKGEIINYDVFYSDYELDHSKASRWRYYHTPKTDGIIANNGVWLSSPITQFTKNGTYRVQHQQTDSTGVTAYDKNSNIIELVIHADDGVTPPAPLKYTPEANITLEGYTKQNRKLTLKLNYSANNALPINTGTINWTLTPVSGMAAADVKRASLTTQNIDTLYKKSGRVRATCTYKDTQGNQGTATTEFDIAADLAPAGTLQVTPIAYRNGSGIATINVKADVNSTDDYINTLKYYITYDADNNGSFTNDTRTYLPQYDNLREFNVDVNAGVGNYMIQADATEGFQEPTIPAYITSTDYLTLSLQGASTVDNISPAYDVRPEKDIYLAGEEIRFKSYDGAFLNGDSSKGFFDTENDPMTGFRVKYTQNKAIMPIQDKTSAYAANIDYMSQVVDWKDADIWSITPHSGGSIVWDSTKQAWKITGDVYMYLKPEYAAKIDPQSSYYMEVKVMRGNDKSRSLYWGGDRLDAGKTHLPGFGGTCDYSAASAAYPAIGTWTTYGKTKAGTSASPDGWGTDGCRYFRIGGLINYNGSSTQVTYIKDIKFITASTTTELADCLDRAGEYTIDINAYDDPKDGDVRFAGYNKPSNTNTNKIIVHRRPVAALSFNSSHAAASAYDFGNYMYLDGTQLRLTDASRDPDGFNVTSTISYKADSGDYIQLNSGDTINLYYGSVFTIKVVTTDNWGADDTAIYTISVINGLDMVPEVMPSPVAASENVTLRLTTNQYATSARAVILGQSVNLPLSSETSTHKTWEAIFNIPETQEDAIYTAQFHAVSEGTVELQKDKDFEVLTPINLVPDMPSEIITGTYVLIKAGTSIYANSATVQLYIGTAYQTSALSMTGIINGDSKGWTVNYAVPDGIPAGNYTARFTAATPNGNIQVQDVTFRVECLKITGVTISGYWNHWRGQVDMFGRQMSMEPHRFLSLEKIKIDIDTTGYAEKIDISFSPGLESMEFTDKDGNQYDYYEDYGLQYVFFPASFTLDGGLQNNHLHWEYTLPLAPSTVGWDDARNKPQYSMTVTAWRGEYSAAYSINDIDITGNIYDLTYIQPID